MAAPVGEVTTPSRRGNSRKRALSLGLEEPLRFEPATQLLEGELQGAQPPRLHLPHDQLEVPTLGIDLDVRVDDDLGAVFELEGEPSGGAAEQSRLHPARLVLEREVDVTWSQRGADP